MLEVSASCLLAARRGCVLACNLLSAPGTVHKLPALAAAKGGVQAQVHDHDQGQCDCSQMNCAAVLCNFKWSCSHALPADGSQLRQHSGSPGLPSHSAAFSVSYGGKRKECIVVPHHCPGSKALSADGSQIGHHWPTISVSSSFRFLWLLQEAVHSCASSSSWLTCAACRWQSIWAALRQPWPSCTATGVARMRRKAVILP